MKKFRKLIVALLAMVMVLGCLAVQASAADGDKEIVVILPTALSEGQSLILDIKDQNAGITCAAVKDVGWDRDVYSFTKDANNDKVYSIVINGDVGADKWFNCEIVTLSSSNTCDSGCKYYPQNGRDVFNNNDKIYISYKSDWTEVTATAEDPSTLETAYYVTGDEKLCGVEWKFTNADNKMTNNSGVWSKTYTSVPAGDYKFKITDQTASWSNSWPNSNYEFTVSTACDVTITFNESTKEVKATGTGFGTPTLEVEKITVAGTANICGTEYNPGLAANDMTANGKVYTKTYTDLAKGDYEIKFVANGSYDVANWGGTFETSGEEAEAVYNASGNIGFEITYTEATVALEFDLTNYDHSTKKGATFTITITDTTPKTDDKDKDTDTDNKSNVVIVTEEEAKAVKDSIKVEGAKETLVVSTVAKDVADLKVVEAALANKLKEVKYVVADLKFESGNQPTKDTKVTIDISKIAAVKDAKYISVYRVDNNDLKLLETVKVTDGKITFAPDHFSTYVFAEGNISNGDLGVSNAVIIVSAVVMFVAATVIVASKKRVTE